MALPSLLNNWVLVETPRLRNLRHQIRRPVAAVSVPGEHAPIVGDTVTFNNDASQFHKRGATPSNTPI